MFLGAMDVALGSAATGVFTNSNWLWEQLHKVLLVQNTPEECVTLVFPLLSNEWCVHV